MDIMDKATKVGSLKIGDAKLYDRTKHAAATTDDYVFSQLIPYIGNKRKLLGLIQSALSRLELKEDTVFLDLFAGSGVVSRLAKSLRYRVIANDWEPYTLPINGCYIGSNKTPVFRKLGGYKKALDTLNNLPPRVDWVTEHLCPRDDDNYDTKTDRMFYMRKNGMRIDAIRYKIKEWFEEGFIDKKEEYCLLAPLLYQVCYTSNTSGVFKGFHNGWGGQTGTALYRICGDLSLYPAVFLNNNKNNEVVCADAQQLAEDINPGKIDIAYLDPPYNQHPYGSNYHVLNSVTLWDKPEISKTITKGMKSAIRKDWRIERRSRYNYKNEATDAYRKLIETLNARYILTSYSTEGTISIYELLRANTDRGGVKIELQGYKRYRVSSQRYSNKPMNVEYIVILDTFTESKTSPDELMEIIESKEEDVLRKHSETLLKTTNQFSLFE